MAQKVKQVAKYPDLARTGLIVNTNMLMNNSHILNQSPDEQYGCLLSTEAVLQQRWQTGPA